MKEYVSREKVSRVLPTVRNNVCQFQLLMNASYPNFKYSLDSKDIKTGSQTSQGTRDYVNGPNFNRDYYKGGSVRLSYNVMSNKTRVIDTKTSVDVPNPTLTEQQMALIRSRVNRSTHWDAGHSFPMQLGGVGDNNAYVFPQFPPINQGNFNSIQIEEGFRNRFYWRCHEDYFTSLMKLGGRHGEWSVSVM